MARANRRAVPAAPPTTTDRRGIVAALLALVALVLVVYASVRSHAYVNFDDTQYVSENAYVKGGLTWSSAKWAFTATHAGNWHPLTWLSHMLDVQLFGLDAGAHHVVNVVFHAANTLLLFWLWLRMTGALGRCAFVAAVFGVHPLHVESVAWVAERKDVLSAFFGLLCLLAHHAYARAPHARRYAAVFLAFALALLAKPMLVTLPLVMLLLDHWPLGRTSHTPLPRLVLEKAPLLALSAASSLLTLWAQRQGGAVKALDALPLGRRLANALVAYVSYLRQTLWPEGLAVLYPYPRSIPGWATAGALLLLMLVTLAVAREGRRRPYLALGWFWYLVMLVPVIGLVQVGSQPMADRYMYLPMVGLLVMAGWGVHELAGAGTLRWLPAAAALTVGACAVVARAQLGHWKESVALWERALAVTHDNARAHSNLAHAYSKQDRAREALPHYQEAVRLKPDFAEAHNNLGHALSELGRTAEAVAHYREAVRLLPDYHEAHNNLGVALLGLGQPDAGIGHLRQALRIRPELAEVHNNLGVALAQQKDVDEAIRAFAAALRLRPDYVDARRNLALAHGARARALADAGKLDDAILGLREALRVNAQDANDHYDLAVLLFRKGATAEALRHLEEALRLDPRHELARRALQALARPAK